MRGFDDKGRIYDKWSPSELYIPQKILALFLTCIGEGLVILGLFGVFVLCSILDQLTGYSMSIIIAIPVIILLLIGLASLFVIPYTIYYMLMWWLTRDSYYINMYNEKT